MQTRLAEVFVLIRSFALNGANSMTGGCEEHARAFLAERRDSRRPLLGLSQRYSNDTDTRVIAPKSFLDETANRMRRFDPKIAKLLPAPAAKPKTPNDRARVCCSLANRSSDESIPTDATESCPFCVRVHLEAIIVSVESRRVCATKDAGHQPPAVVLLARVPPQSAKDPTLQLTPMTMLQRQRDFRFQFFLQNRVPGALERPALRRENRSAKKLWIQCCENSLERVREYALAVGCSFVKRTDRSYNPVFQRVRFNVYFSKIILIVFHQNNRRKLSVTYLACRTVTSE